MTGCDATGWAACLPARIPAIQVLDRLVSCGWPDGNVPAGLLTEARFHLPELMADTAEAQKSRAFLQRELSEDRAGVGARLSFLRVAMRDVASYGDLIHAAPEAFMAQSETFSLFDYQNAQDSSDEAIEAVRSWVDYVSTLTRAEAPFLLPLMDIPATATILEPGGNDGTFARAIAARYAPRRHVVLDLPAVCALGRRRTQTSSILFETGDIRREGWSRLPDYTPSTILFKSVLHDWPLEVVVGILTEAIRGLTAGGRLIIAERDAFSGMTGGTAMDYANLVFAAFYRSSDIYRDILQSIRPDLSIHVQRTVIDMDWYVLTAQVAS